MPFSLSVCSTRSKALLGMSWRFALGKPGTSTPRASICFQPSSFVAAICASIVLPASSPMPVRIIVHLSVERLREIVVFDLDHFLFKLRFGGELLQLLLKCRAVHR